MVQLAGSADRVLPGHDVGEFERIPAMVGWHGSAGVLTRPGSGGEYHRSYLRGA